MKYLIFDTETGGVNEKLDALLSVAAIVLDERLNITSSFYSLIRNDRRLNMHPKALEVNGLNKEKVAQGLPMDYFTIIWAMLLQDVELVIAHNIAFDAKFIKANFMDIPEKTLDTMHVAWDVWPGEKVKLELCYKRMGKTALNAHNALYDCMMTHELLRWFVEQGHLPLPLPGYPIVPDYYERKAFGYQQMEKKGLI